MLDAFAGYYLIFPLLNTFSNVALIMLSFNHRSFKHLITVTAIHSWMTHKAVGLFND